MELQAYIWSLPMSKLDVNSFGDIKPNGNGEYHEHGSKHHDLLSYRKVLEEVSPHYLIELDWNYCSECKQIRNKRLIALDHKQKMAYVREIIRHGELIV